MSTAAVSGIDHAVVWHDAECGSYVADLPLYERLAAERGGPVLDLGAGSGRVALHLARRGHEVIAVDSDPRLLEALESRSAAESLAVSTVCADARELAAGAPVRLAIAPMQLMHLLRGPDGRRAALRAAAARLAPGGLLCAAILDGSEGLASGAATALPDVREVEGWIHSSLPLEVRVGGGRIELLRLRQLVAPDGTLSEERHLTVLEALTAAKLEAEAAAVGLRPAGRAEIDPGDEHVGSLAVMLEREDRDE